MLLPPQYRGSVIAQEKIASDFLIGNLTQEPWYTREVFAGELDRLQMSVLAGLRFFNDGAVVQTGTVALWAGMGSGTFCATIARTRMRDRWAASPVHPNLPFCL